MNLMEFSRNELEALEKSCGDDAEALKMQKLVTQDVMQIMELFTKQSHSGFSAGYMITLLERLLRYKPLLPLTGEADEWEDCSEYGLSDKQNKRCPAVFMRPDGTAYWVEGKIFSDDGGKSWYTNADSRVDIKFPFTVPLASENVYVTPEVSEEGDKNEKK